MTSKTKKKLIEVALPLEAINAACAREKSIRHGHPSTLHLWWARRPLAAARAVIFAQMVDDPSAHPDIFKTEQAQEKERQRLFRVIEDLVKWESTTDEQVLQQARDEIWQSWRHTCAENADHPRAKEIFDRHKLPAFHDPFAGGGALPLEAQRLGLETYASDLNPIAVLINKAMIEVPPKFTGRPPVNPESRAEKALLERTWRGAQGLAEDVRYYGKWMHDEAKKRIGHLYPKIELTAAMAKKRPDLKPLIGQKLTVIAWLWARTVKSPNPAFASVDVPLASTFMLGNKPGKEAYVEAVITDQNYKFLVMTGSPPYPEKTMQGTSAGKWSGFRCLMSDVPVTYDYIRSEAIAGRMGARMMAIVAEGERGRIYLSPDEQSVAIAQQARPSWKPDLLINIHPRDIKTQIYGLTRYGQLFTDRQLVALNTFSELIHEARQEVVRDASKAHTLPAALTSEYADAIAMCMACVLSRAADRGSTICSWDSSPKMEALRNTFGRQALPMTWDFAEGNPFSVSSGSWSNNVEWCAKAVAHLPAIGTGLACQRDAAVQDLSLDKIVSMDPPYYDNIGYADLSDFFYVWLRRGLHAIMPELFLTLAVPKAEELVASPYRHGSKENAEKFFLAGMVKAIRRVAEDAHPAFPVTIYYAFKQTETAAIASDESGTENTGWATFLQAVIEAGFTIDGTWPIRTELGNRLIASSNALASSIVLVCRQRAKNARVATLREFIGAIKAELPNALVYLQRGNIAPVDLAQAAIGPGMAIFTRYSKVIDASGKAMRVGEALSKINAALGEALADQEGDFDADSRWALAWFDQSGFAEGDYGLAETLSKAKNTSVGGLVDAGFVASSRGKVRLLKPSELPKDWDPMSDARLTTWEMVHHLIRVLEADSEVGAAALAAKLGSKAEIARELCYRLYALCERKKRTAEAMSYNSLVQSWPEIMRMSREAQAPAPAAPVQTSLFEAPVPATKKKRQGGRK